MANSSQVAAAVAAAIAAGAAGSAFAAPPSLATAQAVQTAGTNVLYIAGSSAAQKSVLADVQANFCPGASNSLTITSTGNTNFWAVACAPPAATGVTNANGSNVFDIFYRFEGGSVVGALPIVSGKSISQLNLNDNGNITYTSGSATATEAVAGASGTNGIDDSFGGGVVKKPVQLGITDVEPGALISDNYPTAYLASTYGTANAAELAGLTANTLVDQVFGIFVNTGSSGANFKNPTALDLPKSAITNMLQGNITNWSKVQDNNGNAVTTGSLAVTIVNREAGSGSRTSASIFFTGDECQAGAVSILDIPGGTADFFSTGNVLSAANKTAGAITYASIDNNGAQPNLTMVAIGGITPSNLAAANGDYDYWYEATDVPNPRNAAVQSSIINFLETVITPVASAPHVADILAIPGNGGNSASLPVSGTADSSGVGGSATIYVNPYTRSGVSCNTPVSAL